MRFLIGAMEDQDFMVAEDAAICLSFSDDPICVDPLSAWVSERVKRPRSKVQGHATAEAIATCLRLEAAEDPPRIAAVLADVKLTPIEQLALSGKYKGQRFSGEYPQIIWPD